MRVAPLKERFNLIYNIFELYLIQFCVHGEREDGGCEVFAHGEVAGAVAEVAVCLMQVEGFRVVDHGGDAPFLQEGLEPVTL